MAVAELPPGTAWHLIRRELNSHVARKSLTEKETSAIIALVKESPFDEGESLGRDLLLLVEAEKLTIGDMDALVAWAKMI